MKTMTLALLLLMLSPLAVAANKGWSDQTGNDMLPLCSLAVDFLDNSDLSREQAEKALECLHYISGFLDGYTASSALAEGKPMVCFPADSNTGQMVRVAVKWMKDHPEKLNQPASVCVFQAFLDSFACKYPK